MNIVFGLLLLPKVLSHADPFYRSVEGVSSLTQHPPALLVSFVRAVRQSVLHKATARIK